MKIKIFVDGGARGNPGPAGIGVVLNDEHDKNIISHKEFIGNATNNTAEYRALIKGIELSRKYLPCSLVVHLDSELVCKQMQGGYKVKNPDLLELFICAQKLLEGFESVEFNRIPRELNKQADKLVNQAINIGYVINNKK